jgi:hypothetical protein
MAEKNLVINSRTIDYKGIFRMREIFKNINDSIETLGYTKREKKTEEKVTPEGKYFHVEIRPFKVKTSYDTVMIKIKIIAEDIIEVNKQIDGINTKFEQGNLRIIFDAWSLTDWESRWGMKPFVFFFKTLIHKWFYRIEAEEGFIGELKSDTGKIHDNVKALLNLYKYKTQN